MSGTDRRVGWPVLVVLLAFLAGAIYLVRRVHEDTVAGDPGRGATAPLAVDASVPEGEGGYVRHAWGPDGGAPLPGLAPGRDPQRALMERQIGGDAGFELPFEPLEVGVTLLDIEGQPPIGVDSEPCLLRVLPVVAPPYDCVVRVVCGGAVVYPNPSQTGGFNRCALAGRAVSRVEDEGTTAEDEDPTLSLDVARRRLIVGDRTDAGRYRLRFRLDR